MAGPPPVFLVGFMGSGKTEVGRRVAALLGVPFVDLDREIEAEAGASIAEQFARDGEAAFRERETQALERNLDRASVIATGGGLYADAAHRAHIARAGGVAVWLDAPLDELERRVAQDGAGRPRWGMPADVARLFAERTGAYAEADLRIDAACGDQDTVAAAVVAALRSSGRL